MNFVDPSGHISIPILKDIEKWANDTWKRNEDAIVGPLEVVGGAALAGIGWSLCGGNDGSGRACAAPGMLLLSHGIDRMGGQVNMDPRSTQHDVISWQNNPSSNETGENHPLVTIGSTTFSFENGYEKIWNFPNTAIGLLYGLAGLPFGAVPEFGNNAIQFINHPLMISHGAITFGNTISYGKNFGPQKILYGYPVGTHEKQHTFQGEQLGPFYLLSNIAGGMTGLFRNGAWGGPGSANWNEVGPYSSPPRVWQ